MHAIRWFSGLSTLKPSPAAASISSGGKVYHLCPVVQGYLLGWPLTSQQVAEFLRGYVVSDAETAQLAS